jgi:hypothetical protein
MLKLYKRIDNQLQYWETWDKDEKTAIVHWGIVGQCGQTSEVKTAYLQMDKCLVPIKENTSRLNKM